jgi:hypothetical protein
MKATVRQQHLGTSTVPQYRDSADASVVDYGRRPALPLSELEPAPCRRRRPTTKRVAEGEACRACGSPRQTPAGMRPSASPRLAPSFGAPCPRRASMLMTTTRPTRSPASPRGPAPPSAGRSAKAYATSCAECSPISRPTPLHLRP